MITNEEVRRRMKCQRDVLHHGRVWTYICRMNDSMLIKQVVVGMVDGSGIRGRPNKEWLDDIKQWCQIDVHSANILAHSRTEWS